MDMSSIIQLINGVGFPIAACVALFYTMSAERKANDEQREKDREAHANEANTLKQAVDNNTIAITKLVERWDYHGGSN